MQATARMKQERRSSAAVEGMAAFFVGAAMALTGRFWFRKTWRGRLVLLVEDERAGWGGRGERKPRWRDANLLDLVETALQRLVDLARLRR
jgi:hypothetical protein